MSLSPALFGMRVTALLSSLRVCVRAGVDDDVGRGPLRSPWGDAFPHAGQVSGSEVLDVASLRFAKKSLTIYP